MIANQPDIKIRSQNPMQVVIVTGFLGAGKTSFLADLLQLEDMSDCAVIINEFGEFSLDHLLVEHIDDKIFALPNGCLCCSSQNQLVEKMLDFANGANMGGKAPRQIFIETSGIVDTASLVANLWNDPSISQFFHLATIVTVVSALEWPQEHSAIFEANRQLAIGDVVVVSKSDMLPANSGDQDLAHLMAQIELVNSSANCYLSPLSDQQYREIVLAQFCEPKQRVQKQTGKHQISDYRTCTLVHQTPVSADVIELFTDIVLARHGDGLLRLKGLALTNENLHQPLVVQAVRSNRSPPYWLERWNCQPQTRLTLIHNYDNDAVFLDLFRSVLDIPGVDLPDKTALSDNPLSIPGMGEFALK